MSINITNDAKLLDQILLFDCYAGLFTNNVKENEENPTFIEPIFSSYSKNLLDKNNWGPSIKEGDYSSITYNNQITWVNNSENTEIINGYFILDSNDELLWFNVFENPAVIGNNEGVSIYPKVYLNRNDLFNTFFIFKIINPLPSQTILNPTITITNEYWDDLYSPKSLINPVTGDVIYSSTKNSMNLVLDPKIDPSVELTYSFDIQLSQPGFLTYQKHVAISAPGSYDITLYMLEIG